MRTVSIGAVAVVLLSGCSPKATYVDHAWVRLPAVAGQPGAAYFTLHGGSRGNEMLAGVSTPAAAKAEMHESMAGDHGMMSMAPLSRLAIPKNGDIIFAPGGKHVMLYGLTPATKPGATVRLTFAIDGGQTFADAKVVAAGDSAPE